MGGSEIEGRYIRRQIEEACEREMVIEAGRNGGRVGITSWQRGGRKEDKDRDTHQ